MEVCWKQEIDYNVNQLSRVVLETERISTRDRVIERERVLSELVRDVERRERGC